jgi:hypothetical protein
MAVGMLLVPVGTPCFFLDLATLESVSPCGIWASHLWIFFIQSLCIDVLGLVVFGRTTRWLDPSRGSTSRRSSSLISGVSLSQVSCKYPASFHIGNKFECIFCVLHG